MNEFELECKINYSELIKLLEVFEVEKESAIAIADYLTSCVDFTLDLSSYLWNTLPAFVQVFDTKQEALDYLKDNYDENPEDYTIYETSNHKVYVETY